MKFLQHKHTKEAYISFIVCAPGHPVPHFEFDYFAKTPTRLLADLTSPFSMKDRQAVQEGSETNASLETKRAPCFFLVWTSNPHTGV